MGGRPAAGKGGARAPGGSSMADELVRIAQPYLDELDEKAETGEYQLVMELAVLAWMHAELPEGDENRSNCFGLMPDLKSQQELPPEDLEGLAEAIGEMSSLKSELYPDDHRTPGKVSVVMDAAGSFQVKCASVDDE